MPCGRTRHQGGRARQGSGRFRLTQRLAVCPQLVGHCPVVTRVALSVDVELVRVSVLGPVERMPLEANRGGIDRRPCVGDHRSDGELRVTDGGEVGSPQLQLAAHRRAGGEVLKPCQRTRGGERDRDREWNQRRDWCRGVDRDVRAPVGLEVDHGEPVLRSRAALWIDVPPRTDLERRSAGRGLDCAATYYPGHQRGYRETTRRRLRT
jgi:hypothetical protein